MILIATFTANLAAVFAEKDQSMPLKSIDHIQASEYNVFAFDIDKKDFETLGNDLLNRLMNESRIEFVHVNGSGAMKRVIRKRLTSQQVWIGFDMFDDWVEANVKNRYKLDGMFSWTAFSFAMRKDWPKAKEMNDLFIQFGRSGYLDEVDRLHAKAPKKENDQEKVERIKLASLAPALCLMVVGGIISIVIMIISVIHQTRKNLQSQPLEESSSC